MDTIINKIDRNEINEEVIKQAGSILKRGGLVAFPTETVYGLGANALDEEAAQRTYEAKGRPSDNPLIVHIADLQALNLIVKEIPQGVEELAYHFWPGPLTMIFQKSDAVPYGTTGGLDTVAVRMPDDAVARELILSAGGYVSAPSANTSGRPSPTTAEHVSDDLNGKIDMILDGGPVNIGVESTILDMTVSPPMILRPGAVTKEMIEEVIGRTAVDQTLISDDSCESPKAPGMKYRHYAPAAELIIMEGSIEDEVKAIKQVAFEQTRLGFKVGIIATAETLTNYTAGIIKSAGARENSSTIAKNLYRILREFDDEGVDYIYSESFAGEGIGSAVMNRLFKAAGHHTLRAEDITCLQKYRKILFISKSDNCRGPMAAELLRQEPLLQEYEIDSRGLVVLFPEPVNQKAEAIMKSRQMTLKEHMAAAFSEEDLDDETLVLTMEETLKWKIISDYENIRNVYTLGEYIGEEIEIDSAYGQPLNVYGEVFEVLQGVIGKLADKLNEEAREE